MDEMNTIANSCSVCFRCGRVASSIAGFVKTTCSVKKIAPLVLLIPLNVYAAAERFPGVQVQLDEFTEAAVLADNVGVATNAQALDAAVSFESSVPDPVADQAGVSTGIEGVSPDPETAGGNTRSAVVNQELASLDVVDTGVLKQVQNSQPAPVVSRETTSLEVVDTGTARQVQNPQPVEAVTPETESLVESESAAVTAAPGGTVDDPVKNHEVMLPAAEAAESTGRVETVVAMAGNAGARSEVASGSVSEEVVHLPYAVLLAILALMSMIPVARRKG